MKEANDTLPENMKSLVANLTVGRAVPLGDIDGVPFIALRITQERAASLLANGVKCELKPSMININFDNETLAIGLVQLRINSDDALIFTLTYNLNFDKHYEDCISLLNMKKYGLFIATEDKHEFISFNTEFEADFNPQDIVRGTKSKATDYPQQLFDGVVHGLKSQVKTNKELWDMLGTMVPFEKSWYASMDMHSEKE